MTRVAMKGSNRNAPALFELFPDLQGKLPLKTYGLLRHASRLVPDVTPGTPVILGGYLGNGYGHPTGEGMAVLELFKSREGIDLDPVYTGKACAALLDFVRNPSRAEEPVLYWHMYNSVDLDADAASVDYRELPPELHHVFEGEFEEAR